MFDKFTDKARKVMSLAQEEARGLDQLYVGTEHLLLALIKEGEGIAAQALAKLDVTYDETLATVKELTTGSGDPVPGGHIPFTPRTKRVLEDAYRETMTHGQTYIGTEHLLLGIVSEGNGRAMDALRTMGVSGDAVRNAVEELIESGTPGGSGPGGTRSHSPVVRRDRAVLLVGLLPEPGDLPKEVGGGGVHVAPLAQGRHCRTVDDRYHQIRFDHGS